MEVPDIEGYDPELVAMMQPSLWNKLLDIERKQGLERQLQQLASVPKNDPKLQRQTGATDQQVQYTETLSTDSECDGDARELCVRLSLSPETTDPDSRELTPHQSPSRAPRTTVR